LCLDEFIFSFSFGAFEEFKKYMANEKGQLTSSTRLLCGLGAGV